MNKLLEIKDKAVKFCGEYEHFILPVVRFAVAFIAFITIDLNIGYNRHNRWYVKLKAYRCEYHKHAILRCKTKIDKIQYQSTTKLNVTMGQLLDNKEMFIVMAIFVITTLVVYQVRRLKINNSWTVATIAGGLIQLVALVVAYLVLGLPEKIIWLVLSTVAAIFAGVVIQFIFMNLDYARTENVQFEDDEYYYYVKAVPKKMIAKEEKVVKHFGNTGSLGKKIPRHNQENISKEAIAKDLEIDENIFEDDK